MVMYQWCVVIITLHGILKKLFHFLQETVGGVAGYFIEAGIFSMRASERGLSSMHNCFHFGPKLEIIMMFGMFSLVIYE